MNSMKRSKRWRIGRVAVITLPFCALAIGTALWLWIGSAMGASEQERARLPKKLIYYGWSTRDTVYVRDHWREMEQMPFDGIGIHVAIDRAGVTTGAGSTGNLLSWQVFGPRAFRLADFQPAIADLRIPQWSHFS